MTLGEKQKLFAKNIALLISHIYASGYEVTFGDAWSKPEYKAHKANSCHYDRLAIDLNLFKDGAYLTDTMAHEPFGKWWEGLNKDNRWGGRFHDGNHYSMTPDGRRA